MSSVARNVTQSPPSVEIDGVLHRQCGEGRKQRRAGAVECGRILPLSAFPIHNGYTDGHALVCQECKDKQDARYAERVATALVPVKVYDDVPIGNGGTCRGVSILVDGVEIPHLVMIEACRFWGLDGQGQIQRIQEDPTLSAGLRVCKMHTPHGSTQPNYALRYDLVPLWLAGVETGRMRNRERASQLAAFQMVCAQVLADYFFNTKTAPPPPSQRIETDASIVGHDAPVLVYIENALAPLYERLGILDLLPGIDKNTRQLRADLSGVKRIETEIEVEIEVRGVVYFCEFPRIDWDLPLCEEMYADGYVLCAVGWTTKLDVAERLAEYRGKYPLKVPIEFHIVKTDDRRLENLLQKRRPADQSVIGPIKGTRDLFWMKPSAIALAKALPLRLSYEKANNRLHRWAMVKNGADIKW